MMSLFEAGEYGTALLLAVVVVQIAIGLYDAEDDKRFPAAW